MITKLASLFSLVCVATVLTLALAGGYGVSQGYLSRPKLTEIVALLNGEASTAAPEEKLAKKEDTSEQPSLDDMEEKRALKTRQLELREQAIASGVSRISFEQSQLKSAQDKYNEMQQGFTKNLTALRTDVQKEGITNLRLIWENIKPKQAKEQILQMVEANEQQSVVETLTGMPIAKRAKIIGEFKTEDETKKLEILLRMIRQGQPDADLIDNTRKEIDKFKNPVQ